MVSPKRTATPQSSGGSRSATKPGSYCPDVGDLIWIDLESTKGHEQRHRRPALVLSPRVYNQRVDLCIACPITNQAKGYPFEVALPAGHEVSGVVLADQIRSMSWPERRTTLIGAAPVDVLDEVREKIAPLIGIE